jgi:hypothetical protein
MWLLDNRVQSPVLDMPSKTGLLWLMFSKLNKNIRRGKLVLILLICKTVGKLGNNAENPCCFLSPGAGNETYFACLSSSFIDLS